MSFSHSRSFCRTASRRACAAAAPFALLVSSGAVSAQTGPQLSINATASTHAISPDIYGIDITIDPKFAAEIKLPVARMGGDGMTRYNWQVDGSNAGGDWYFMAGSGIARPIAGASIDTWILGNKTAGARSVLTIPIIKYINKATSWDCSFPVSIFGAQQSVNPYVHPIVNGQQTDAGNGVAPDGTVLQPNEQEILRVHVPNSTSIQKQWIQHLTKKWGVASKGGVAVYQMDNEPSGWGNTHRDVHPGGTGYDELVNATLPYAEMVKATDPSALVLGPSDFGWAAYIGAGITGDDATSHGVGLAEYYLQKMAAYDKAHKQRLLDYFDEHYYPTTNDGLGPLALSPAGDAATQALRLQSTRSLWDRTYVEKNWIGKWYGAINLIPRFRAWVAKDYPGTKVAVTEYNWGGMESINGALTQADVLGIFGREQLDMATMWGAPTPTQPAAYAFRIYRNYDGKGSQYGDTYVLSTSTDQSKLSVYGALRTRDGALTLVVINKTAGNLTSKLALSNFKPAKTATLFRYSSANLSKIVTAPSIAVAATGFSATYPAYSITEIVIPKG